MPEYLTYTTTDREVRAVPRYDLHREIAIDAEILNDYPYRYQAQTSPVRAMIYNPMDGEEA